MQEANKIENNLLQDALPMELSIQMMTAKLDLQLRFDQIPMLRGAIVEAAGKEELDLLHNHKEGERNYHYRYPLVQYRIHQGKAMLVGFNEGAETLREVLLKVRTIRLGGKELPLRLYKLQEKDYKLSVVAQERYYRLHHWLALNEENYKLWQKCDNLVERVELLERVLVAHLLSFSKGMHWQLPQRLHLRLVDLIQHKVIRFHDVPLMAFDVVYKANVQLPPLMALGKAVSHGFGWQIPYRMKR